MSGAEFDFSPVRPRLKYILCATVRSGSFMLCRQLINAGLGVPHEYYNRYHCKILCERWGLPSEMNAEYQRQLYVCRTTPNGVWASKLHWPQYVRNQALLDGELQTIRHYLYLVRSDVVAQGVSLHLSHLTGQWGFDGVVTSPPNTKLDWDDLEHVAECVEVVQATNMAWRAYFAERNLSPLVVHYDAFVTDQPGQVGRIANYLGLTPAEYCLPPPEPRTEPYSAELEAMRKLLMQRFRERSRQQRYPFTH